MPDDGVFLVRYEQGKETPVKLVACGECRNEWYIPALSVEWRPKYCCYCGIRFITEVVTDVPLTPKR